MKHYYFKPLKPKNIDIYIYCLFFTVSILLKACVRHVCRVNKAKVRFNSTFLEHAFPKCRHNVFYNSFFKLIKLVFGFLDRIII